MPKLRLILAVAVLAALLVAPATARATLAFVRKPLNPVVWVADDNGKHAHKLVQGNAPRVSPDGEIVALQYQGKGRRAQPELVLAPADGSAPPSTLVKGWRDPYVFAWSPDSKSVVAVLGPELGKQRLVLIDTVTGAQRTIARGFFNGVSFNPAGTRLVYGRSTSESFPPRSDIYRYSTETGNPPRLQLATEVGNPGRLTRDHRSTNPVWGPNGKIVFVKQLGAKKRRYGPKNELYLMNEAGGKVRRLTHTRVSPLAQGLTPTAWSRGGTRLLAQFGGQDLTYAVSVNPRTGAQRPLVEATEQGFVGAGFSANGKRVLGSTGGFEWGNASSVATVPYPHGKPRILVRRAFEPSWGG